MKKAFSIILGAVLILIGVLYSLNVLGITDVKISLDGWWTLFIIIPCLGGLFTDKDKIGSLIGLSLGIFLLLASRKVIEFSLIWELMIPLIAILIGIKFIIRAVCKNSDSKAEDNFHGNGSENAENGSAGNDKECDKTKEECVSVFGSNTSDFSGKDIKKAKIGAFFGGAKCNLSNAIIADGSQIDLCCAFGGADIILPEDVEVKINAFCLFGGISDKRTLKARRENANTIIINGFCIFGGADIR